MKSSCSLNATFSGGIVGAESVQPGQIASWNATGDGWEGGFPGIMVYVKPYVRISSRMS